MGKIQLLLDKLGISLTPLERFVQTQWGHLLPVPVVSPNDVETYRNFIATLFINAAGSDKGSRLPSSRDDDDDAPKFEKRLSTLRLMEDVANYLMSKKGCMEDNVLVSGFAYKWIYDGSGSGATIESGKVARGTDARHCEAGSGVGSRGKEVEDDNVGCRSQASYAAPPGNCRVGTLRTESSASGFRLEGGTGIESLQYFTTVNWRLLHSRLGDDLCFEMLTTKMIFATCG